MKETDLVALIDQVQRSKKYHDVAPQLIARIGRQELAVRKNLKAAVKSTKNKLHQVGGAYWGAGLNGYANTLQEIERVKNDAPAVKQCCRTILSAHASTSERLDDLDLFYTQILGALPRPDVIVDLACGLNPFCWPWMGLSPDTSYIAVDIYGEMLAFVQGFFDALGVNGRTLHTDLLSPPPPPPADIALLLKTIPCLEQIESSAAPQLLDLIQARFLVISYPRRSLGGRDRGMDTHYRAHFDRLAARRSWLLLAQLEFNSELVFLVEAK